MTFAGLLFGLVVLAQPAAQAEPAVAKAPAVPGWRVLTRKDVENDPNMPFRRASDNGYLRAKGDFDGDGEPDFAALAMSAQGDRAAVIFRLSSRPQPVVHVVDARAPAASLGVNRVAPGTYKTACAKGYGASEGCVGTFTGRNEGVQLFQFETSSLYLFWTGERLVETDISD